MLRIAVLVSGGGTNLQNLIDAAADGRLTNTEFVGVISSRSRAYALERAAAAGIPTFVLAPQTFPDREAFHEALQTLLLQLKPDLIVLAGFLVVLPESLIQHFENRILNIHPSLIPAFCGPGFHGLKVHEAALARGVRFSGATVHFVDSGTDTGPIIAQSIVPVLPDDTPETLQARIQKDAEAVLLPQVVQWIADGRVQVQGGKVTVTPCE